MERLTAKLVSSFKELLAHAPSLSWLLNIYPANIRKHPLLCYTVPRFMPSLPVLFRVCKEENQPPRSVCEVPSHTRFIKLAYNLFPLPNQFIPNPKDAYTTITVLGMDKNVPEAKIKKG